LRARDATQDFSEDRMSNLLVVDDHPILRQGLVQLLASRWDAASIRQASTSAEALAEFHRARPDAVILDLTLGTESGLDVMKRMHEIDASVPVLILTMHDESLHAERALVAGARGYVMKHEAAESVIDAVRRLLAGELVFSRSLQNQFLMSFSKRSGARAGGGLSALTEREIEILRLIGMGHATTQIAARLSRSVKTIEAHRASIRSKLGLESAFELVRYAMWWTNE
jgi:DNA-binding NarL/FixJ family response regulator